MSSLLQNHTFTLQRHSWCPEDESQWLWQPVKVFYNPVDIYLNIYYMDCHKILQRHSWFPDAPPAVVSTTIGWTVMKKTCLMFPTGYTVITWVIPWLTCSVLSEHKRAFLTAVTPRANICLHSWLKRTGFASNLDSVDQLRISLGSL